MSKQSTRSSKSPKFSKVSFRFKSVSSKVRSSFVRSAYSGILAKHDGPADNKKEKTLMPLAYLEPELFECLLERDKRKVTVNNVDRTPKALVPFFFIDESRPVSSFFESGIKTLQKLPGIVSYKPSDLRESKVTMDELTSAVISNVEAEEEPETTIPGIHLIQRHGEIIAEPDKNAIYIKIMITETDDIVFYESPSLTMLKEDYDEMVREVEEKTKEETQKPDQSSDLQQKEKSASQEGELVETVKTIPVEVIKRVAHAEAQTSTILHKSKHANTDRIKKVNQSSFVSNYDMWDTYADLQTDSKEINTDTGSLEITSFYKSDADDLDAKLVKNQNFRKSSMVIERLLAGNIFGERQKRFRNFRLPDPYDKNIKYLYRLDTLWTYRATDLTGKAIADVSWCPRNGDILAVAYGVYGFADHEFRKAGHVCIWSIKNPVNPERKWTYDAAVTAVAFSPKTPQLLAIGLYNGKVEVRDITQEGGPPIARTDRKTSPGFEPVMQIEWVETLDDKEIMLAASLDGTIMKYTVVNGAFLLGQNQMTLDRVEGVVEGLKIAKNKPFLEADRHPQALCIRMHPSQKEVYLVGTDEGCLHRCSIYYAHQHISVMQAHQGGIYAIRYSPWSPKLFLTCGADWKLRIWADGIYEPIVELSHSQEPYQCALWSPIYSTVLATCSRHSVQIWDLRRKNMKPASETFFDSHTTLTVIKFSSCGRSIIVGDAEGKVHVCALEDMPFVPHFQYNELENALNRILERNHNLLKQFQELGYLGY